MKGRTASRLARSMWALALALLIGQLVLVFLNRSIQTGEDVFVGGVGVVAAVGFATVGTLIASRQPENTIGWIFCTIALGFAIAFFAVQYAIRGLVTAATPLPGTTFAAWFQQWVFIVAVAPLGLTFLLFPNGRPPTRKWRPVGWILAAGATVAAIGFVLRPGPVNGLAQYGIRVDNPTGIESLGRDLAGTIIAIGGVPAFLAALASGVGLVVRFRRARGDERQQIKWLAYVALAVLTLFVSLNLFGFITSSGGEDALLGDIGFYMLVILLAIGIPGASGIAILKYRLYDLDVVVKKTVVFGLVAAFITAVYVLVVIAIPALVVGLGTDAGFSPLTLLSTVIVAIAFQPVRNRARRLADRLVYGKRASPYEVLSEFSDRLAGAYSTEDVLPRMAQILGAGTGVERAQVWLRVGGELRPAASWPAEDGAAPIGLRGDELPSFPDQHAVEVRHQGELLGALSVRAPANDPMNPAREKLVHDLAAQAGLVLRNVRLIEELRASRQRLVAAQDEERRKIERNLHDGAQQQLVALSVKFRLARSMSKKDPQKADALFEEIETETGDALETLRDLARGIYPPLLADKGLAAALTAQARKAPVPVEIDTDGVGRYPREIESAVYFCCLEALANVAKYASASHAELRLSAGDGDLCFEVEDDGVGFDPGAVAHGTGLQGMADRLDAIGGTLEVRSAPGSGTTVTGTVPVRERTR
ncbi:MAG: sensor histidine kinase [Actinobacteria bacterium]|nr:sensor histidine kinase [Actinomycetota bacterium]